MVPASWVPLESLPLTPNGKIDRERLPRPEREHLPQSAGAGAEPRDDLERRVVSTFEAVLGVERIGAEDDFFALGGHSLRAMTLFTELEKGGGRRLPPATILEASTPRALAERLRATAPPRQRWSNLVALKPFGTRPPLFAVTAGDGNVVGFGPLAREIAADQPLYALQPSGLDGRGSIDRGIETMAATCVEEIRAVRPRGPYLLAGRCNGATVAYEIAQQLRRAGEQVPLLVAIDSDPPPAGPRELEPGLPTDPFMETAWLRALEAGEAVPDRGGGEGGAALLEWLRSAVAPGVSRYVHEVWHWREDLRRRWPDPLGGDAPALGEWAWESGVSEHRLAPRLLRPVLSESCRDPGGHRWDWALDTLWRERGELPSDPLSKAGWRELRALAREPLAGGKANRYLLAAARRGDLAAAFPDPLGADLVALRHWTWIHGIEEGLDPLLLPPPARRRPRWLQKEALGRGAELALAPLRVRAERITGETVAAERDRAVHGLERRLGRPLPGARERIERRLVVAARAARESYRADPWPGKVVLISSTEFERKPAYAAWPERAEIERRRLPLGHVEMLRDPGAKLLAACLDERIAIALRG